MIFHFPLIVERMKPFILIRVFEAAILALTITSSALATGIPDIPSFFGINLGFSPSKTSLGAFWATGSNQWNLGFLVPPFQDDDFTQMMPGLTYNRQITSNHFFVSGGVYAPRTSKQSGSIYFDSTISRWKTDSISDRRGWETPILMVGGGKVYQFKNWGIHTDASVLTPTNSQIGRSWDWLLGAGVSWRGILD